jgi:hypothetical protein
MPCLEIPDGMPYYEVLRFVPAMQRVLEFLVRHTP